MAEKELVDGAFYWVRYEIKWQIARYEAPSSMWPDPAWWVTGSDVSMFHSPDEIGPCLGKVPPGHGLDADEQSPDHKLSEG